MTNVIIDAVLITQIDHAVFESGVEGQLGNALRDPHREGIECGTGEAGGRAEEGDRGPNERVVAQARSPAG